MAIIRYVERIFVTNKRTANEYLSRLVTFEIFIKENWKENNVTYTTILLEHFVKGQLFFLYFFSLF